MLARNEDDRGGKTLDIEDRENMITDTGSTFGILETILSMQHRG